MENPCLKADFSRPHVLPDLIGKGAANLEECK